MRDGGQIEDDRLGFYYRMVHERKRKDYEGRFRDLLGDDFPNGLERVHLGSFSGGPRDGVSILKHSPAAHAAGIRAGDVVVALDGYRVRTRRQYFVISHFSDGPDMTVIVFRHPGYIELKARTVGRALWNEARSVKPVSS